MCFMFLPHDSKKPGLEDTSQSRGVNKVVAHGNASLKLFPVV